MANDPWEGDIPGRYKPGQKVVGKVTKLTNFGVFVELEQGLEGLLHISELSDDKIESPEEVVKVGDDIEVKVLRVDAKDRKIGLSKRNVDDPTVPDDIPDMPIDDITGPTATTEGSTKPKKDKDKDKEKDKDESKTGLRGGTGAAGPLIQMPGQEKTE